MSNRGEQIEAEKRRLTGTRQVGVRVRWDLTLSAALELDLDFVVVGEPRDDLSDLSDACDASIRRQPLGSFGLRGRQAHEVYDRVFGNSRTHNIYPFRDRLLALGWTTSLDAEARRWLAVGPPAAIPLVQGVPETVPTLVLKGPYAHEPASLDSWPVGQAPGERERFSNLVAKLG